MPNQPPKRSADASVWNLATPAAAGRTLKWDIGGTVVILPPLAIGVQSEPHLTVTGAAEPRLAVAGYAAGRLRAVGTATRPHVRATLEPFPDVDGVRE